LPGVGSIYKANDEPTKAPKYTRGDDQQHSGTMRHVVSICDSGSQRKMGGFGIDNPYNAIALKFDDSMFMIQLDSVFMIQLDKMVYTIGHSNHTITAFVALLRQHSITAVCDVRSRPYSRWVPQFDRDALKASLVDSGITYVFLGAQLGARSHNPDCYVQGKVQFHRLAQQPVFAQGISRVKRGMTRHRVVLMCTERDPLDCHRAMLVARRLYDDDIAVTHIHYDGSAEPHQIMESRLLALCKLPEGDMFKAREECVAEAYVIRAGRIAYQKDSQADLGNDAGNDAVKKQD
jgi:hypothetical protein